MEYASDEARRLVQTMRGCHHGRTWAVYCRDCEIVGLRQTYADSIRRARNAEQRLLAMGEAGNPPDVRADVRAEHLHNPDCYAHGCRFELRRGREEQAERCVELSSQIDVLRAETHKHAEHTADCDVLTPDEDGRTPGCSCGLTAALRGKGE